MANLASKGFVLNFQTNLHTGGGDANYGIIDKSVQREPATSRPIIHSSSLKGALREYFEQPKKYPFDTINKKTNNLVKEVFGTHQDDNDMETGKCRFLAAYLLSLPVRSNVTPYFMATSVDVLDELIQEAKSTGFKLNPTLIAEINSIIGLFKENEKEAFHKGGPFIFTEKFGSNITLEDWKSISKNEIKVIELEKITGNHLAVFNSKDFADLCNQLPVIARNQLENGVSKNLWYEEVVPRFSRFFQFILIPDEKNPSTDSFIEELLDSNNTFQIGANATIGYGYCKFNTLEEKLIPAAIKAVNDKMSKDGKVNSAYKGYISAFGAGIIQSGLLPTLAMFKGNEDNEKKKAETGNLLNAVYEVVKSKYEQKPKENSLFDYVLEKMQKENDRQGIINEVINASVAVKLAIRTFKLIES